MELVLTSELHAYFKSPDGSVIAGEQHHRFSVSISSESEQYSIMDYDEEKVHDMVLALLWLTTSEEELFRQNVHSLDFFGECFSMPQSIPDQQRATQFAKACSLLLREPNCFR
jgi:hypothetical protein